MSPRSRIRSPDARRTIKVLAGLELKNFRTMAHHSTTRANATRTTEKNGNLPTVVTFSNLNRTEKKFRNGIGLGDSLRRSKVEFWLKTRRSLRSVGRLRQNPETEKSRWRRLEDFSSGLTSWLTCCSLDPILYKYLQPQFTSCWNQRTLIGSKWSRANCNA